MGPARTEHPLGILLLLNSAVAGAAYPQPTELQLYGHHGSDILIPGAGMELQGDGLLEWHVKKPGDQERPWILTYHYGSKEPEMSAKYEHRVVFSMKNASLKLLNLTRQDDGLYILEMNSLDNQDEKHVSVRVLEPISDIKVMKCKSSGDYWVRLMCEASGDVWNLTWWHNGRQLVQDITHDGNTSVLDIKEVGTGSYNCVAWNPISELETSYQVAQKSIMILYLVGLLTAAVVFSLLYLTQLFLCLMCSYRCPEQSVRVFQRAAFVCWFLFLICALVSAVVRQAASVSYAFPELNLLFLVVLTVCFTIELFSLSDRKCLKKDGKRQDNQDPTLDRKKSSCKVNGIQDMDKESKKALRAVQSIVQSRLDSNSSRGGNSETAEEPSDGDPEPLNEPEGDDTSKGDILPETPDPTLDKKKSSVKVNGIQDMAKQSKKTLRGVLDKLLLLLRLAALLVSWVTLLVYFIYDCHAYKKTAHFELTISLAVVVPTVLFILTCWCCCPNGPIGRWLDRPCKDRVMKKPTKDLELGGLPDNVPGGEVTYSPVMSSDSVGT